MKVEYKVISSNEIIKHGKLKYSYPEDNTSLIENYINKFGEEGWELVSVVNGNRTGTSINHTLYFKRLKN